MVFRVLARPLLATWFVYEGAQRVLEPERTALRAAPVVEPALKELGLEDVKVIDVVKVHGAATVVAATALALSRSPRTAGIALAGLAALSLISRPPFWDIEEPDTQAAERDDFLKGVSLLGGLLLAGTAGHSPKRKKRIKERKAKKKAKAARKTGA
jgi:uncharacterized membrane protein YphA (DoxX/SURF4 family)